MYVQYKIHVYMNNKTCFYGELCAEETGSEKQEQGCLFLMVKVRWHQKNNKSVCLEQSLWKGDGDFIWVIKWAGLHLWFLSTPVVNERPVKL